MGTNVPQTCPPPHQAGTETINYSTPPDAPLFSISINISVPRSPPRPLPLPQLPFPLNSPHLLATTTASLGSASCPPLPGRRCAHANCLSRGGLDRPPAKVRAARLLQAPGPRDGMGPRLQGRMRRRGGVSEASGSSPGPSHAAQGCRSVKDGSYATGAVSSRRSAQGDGTCTPAASWWASWPAPLQSAVVRGSA